MEQPGGVSPRRDRGHHVAELRDRGVGEHLLDVVGHQGEKPEGEQGDGPDDHHPGSQVGGQVLEKREHPGHQIDPGGHHGGGVHQRRDRGRAGHGVRKPDVERELCALPHRPEEEEGPADDRHGRQRLEVTCGRLVQGEEIPGADGNPQDHRTEDEPDVGHLVDHERLVAGVHVGHVLPVEPDEEVGGEAYSLPADDELDQIRGADQDQHRSGEE